MKLITTQTRLAKKLGALSLIAALVFNPLAAVTQAANEISRLVPFQGRLHGTDNKAVADGVYDITFNVYDTPTGGTPAWTESHAQVSVIHGYVNVLLGAITPMHDVNYANVTATPAYDNSKNLVDFTTKKYLGISINGGVEMFPRSQLVPSFHAYTANHADHASDSDKLGGIESSDYALKTYVNTADGVLNQRITDEILGVDGDTASLSSRTTILENKFTGAKAKDADLLDGLNSTSYMRQISANGYYGLAPNGSSSDWVRTTTNGLLPYESGGSSSVGTSTWPFSKIYGNDIYDNGTLLESKYLGISAKAVDADKLDNIDSSQFARTDVHETFDSHITVNNDVHVGMNDGGDSSTLYYDDNSDAWRTLQWDDSANRFNMELNGGEIIPMAGGIRTLYSDNTGNRYITETADQTADWGPGLYIVVTRGHWPGNELIMSSLIMIYDQNVQVVAPMSSTGWLWRNATGQWSSMQTGDWAANILRIYKVMAPIY